MTREIEPITIGIGEITWSWSFEDTDGTKNFINNLGKEWLLNGVYHRENGPAIDRKNGLKCWCKYGKLHREDGPAIIFPNGHKQWFIHGNKLTLQTIELFRRRIRNHKLRKLIKLLKNEAFWIWYMNPNNIGGRNAIKKIEYMLKEMKLMI